MKRIMMFFGIAGLAAAAFFAAPASADTLEEIKKKGEIVIGTKADYPPYGGRDSSGGIVGMEPDMAADIAKRLGVKLRLEPVVSSNRMQFLQQGKIDLMIATMSVNEERKKAVGIVEPYYYASGIALLANKKANIKSAVDMKGKPICAIQGAYYNNEISAKYTGQDLVAFKGVPENQQALLSGQCVGFVYDDVNLIYAKKAEPEKWADYEVVMITEIAALPWGAAVKLEERDGPWGKFVSGVIADWLKSGTLLALEKKWLGQNTEWLVEASKKAGFKG